MDWSGSRMYIDVVVFSSFDGLSNLNDCFEQVDKGILVVERVQEEDEDC